MKSTTYRSVRIIELSGPPASGKSVAANQLLRALPEEIPAGFRKELSGVQMRRTRYFPLVVVHLHQWAHLYLLLVPVYGMTGALNRVGKYLKHTWRRHEQLRSRRYPLIIEDEGFISRITRDARDQPNIEHWLRNNIDLLYPRQSAGIDVEYVVIPIPISELLRIQRLLRRRLERSKTPAEAAHRTRRNGLHSGDSAARRRITEILANFPHVRLADDVSDRVQLAMNPMAESAGRH